MLSCGVRFDKICVLSVCDSIVFLNHVLFQCISVAQSPVAAPAPAAPAAPAAAPSGPAPGFGLRPAQPAFGAPATLGGGPTLGSSDATTKTIFGSAGEDMCVRHVLQWMCASLQCISIRNPLRFLLLIEWISCLRAMSAAQ